MKLSAFALLLVILGFMFYVAPEACYRHADAQGLSREEAVQKGVEVLTRGPIHEAFADLLTVDPRPNPIILQKPPPAIEEIPPDQKPDGSHIQWISGYFAWDETSEDYIWISGFWRNTPPAHQWMAGHWHGEGDGWQWVSGYWADEGQTEVAYLPPPPLSIDRGPSSGSPGGGSFYTPGNWMWMYQDSRYAWRPGFWQQPNENWFYNPARYTYTPAGYIFSDGYWDYPLNNRGMLFAPVRFDSQVWGWSGWNYQPRYVVSNQALLGSMFVRPEFGRYYFGNYYGGGYGQMGFVPWFDYRARGNVPDPLFNYYRWQSRADLQWEQNLRKLYVDRRAGTAPLPPATLQQQIQLINYITVNNSVKTGNTTLAVTDPKTTIQQLTVIAPITQASPKGLKLVPVSKSAAAQELKTAQQIRAAALDRQKREIGIVAKGAHPIKPTDLPIKVKVSIPKASGSSKIAKLDLPALALPKQLETPPAKFEPIKPLRIESPKQKGKDFTQPSKQADAPPPAKGKPEVVPVPKPAPPLPQKEKGKSEANPGKGKSEKEKDKGVPPEKSVRLELAPSPGKLEHRSLLSRVERTRPVPLIRSQTDDRRHYS